jgi:hypothetical protein
MEARLYCTTKEYEAEMKIETEIFQGASGRRMKNTYEFQTEEIWGRRRGAKNK